MNEYELRGAFDAFLELVTENPEAVMRVVMDDLFKDMAEFVSVVQQDSCQGFLIGRAERLDKRLSDFKKMRKEVEALKDPEVFFRYFMR